MKKKRIIIKLIFELESTYPDLKLGTSTRPDAFISGNVNTQADKNYIRSILHDKLGMVPPRWDCMLKVKEDKVELDNN